MMGTEQVCYSFKPECAYVSVDNGQNYIKLGRVKEMDTDYSISSGDHPVSRFEFTTYGIPRLKPNRGYEPTKVIFNNPATICFWPNGSKTVVKCHEGDTYSKQMGLLMCIAKHYYGNCGRWLDVLRENGALDEESECVR